MSFHGNVELPRQTKRETSTTFPLEEIARFLSTVVYVETESFQRCLWNNNPIEILVVYSCLMEVKTFLGFMWKIDNHSLKKSKLNDKQETHLFYLFEKRMCPFDWEFSFVLIIYVNPNRRRRFKVYCWKQKRLQFVFTLGKIGFIANRTSPSILRLCLVFPNLI